MSDFFIELIQWYNLLFVLPVLMLLVYQLLHTLTGVGVSGLDTSFGDIDIIVAEQLSQMQSRSPFSRFFAFLNAGQIPPQMVLVTFLLCWGFIGFICNHWLIPLFTGLVFLAVLTSAFIAFIFSSMITRFVSQAIAFVFPTSQADEFCRADLVGTVAKVMSREVNTRFGVAWLEEPFRLTVFCHTDGDEERIRKGEKVLLWDYDPQTHFYKVQRLEKGLE